MEEQSGDIGNAGGVNGLTPTVGALKSLLESHKFGKIIEWVEQEGIEKHDFLCRAIYAFSLAQEERYLDAYQEAKQVCEQGHSNYAAWWKANITAMICQYETGDWSGRFSAGQVGEWIEVADADEVAKTLYMTEHGMAVLTAVMKSQGIDIAWTVIGILQARIGPQPDLLIEFLRWHLEQDLEEMAFEQALMYMNSDIHPQLAYWIVECAFRCGKVEDKVLPSLSGEFVVVEEALAGTPDGKSSDGKAQDGKAQKTPVDGNGNRYSVVDVIEALLRQQPDNLWLLRAYGRIHEARGFFQEALALYGIANDAVDIYGIGDIRRVNANRDQAQKQEDVRLVAVRLKMEPDFAKNRELHALVLEQAQQGKLSGNAAEAYALAAANYHQRNASDDEALETVYVEGGYAALRQEIARRYEQDQVSVGAMRLFIQAVCEQRKAEMKLEEQVRKVFAEQGFVEGERTILERARQGTLTPRMVSVYSKALAAQKRIMERERLEAKAGMEQTNPRREKWLKAKEQARRKQKGTMTALQGKEDQWTFLDRERQQGKRGA